MTHHAIHPYNPRYFEELPRIQLGIARPYSRLKRCLVLLGILAFDAAIWIGTVALIAHAWGGDR